MRYIFALFAIASIVIVVYFDRLNPESVTVNLGREYSYHVSMAGFFLFSLALGAFIVILFTLLRDARNKFQELSRRREKRIEKRVQESFSKGLYACLSGKHDQSISFFQDVIKIDPNHYYTLLRIGDSYLKEHNYSEAIRFHKRASQLDEKNLEAHFALANDYMVSGSYEDAISIFRELIKNDSSNTESLIRLRDIYEKTGRWEEAHEIQGRLVKCRKDNKDDMKRLMGLRYEFANVLYKRGEKDKGKKLLQAIIRADKEFVPAFIALGDILIETGAGPEAADLWESGYDMNSCPILLHKLEDYYIYQGEPGKIISIYKKAISRHPDNTTVLKFYLGKLYYRLEMLDDAYDILSDLEGTEGAIQELYKLLGNIYERREEPGKAIFEFKKALGLRKKVIVPYHCLTCEYHTYEWSGRCPGCGEWNTLALYPVDLKKDRYPAGREKLPVAGLEPSYKDRIEWGGA